MRQGATFVSQSDADTLSALQQHPTAVEPGFPICSTSCQSSVTSVGAFTTGLMAVKES
jgi:hypothetical protein